MSNIHKILGEVKKKLEKNNLNKLDDDRNYYNDKYTSHHLHYHYLPSIVTLRDATS